METPQASRLWCPHRRHERQTILSAHQCHPPRRASAASRPAEPATTASRRAARAPEARSPSSPNDTDAPQQLARFRRFAASTPWPPVGCTRPSRFKRQVRARPSAPYCQARDHLRSRAGRDPPDPVGLSAIPVSAGALVFDRAGRLLILKPTYKSGWTIPGGVLETDGETPGDAGRREVAEELGLHIDAGHPVRLAAWTSAVPPGLLRQRQEDRSTSPIRLLIREISVSRTISRKRPATGVCNHPQLPHDRRPPTTAPMSRSSSQKIDD